MHGHTNREAWIEIDPDSVPPPAAPGRWTFEFLPAMGRLLEAHPTIGPEFKTLYGEIMGGRDT